MKKLAIAIFIATVFLIWSANSVFARQGCCSHHGGVCGCHCCDGKSLSAKCAPYYPNCNNGSTITYNASQKEEKKWYQSGWVYLIGGIALWTGGVWIKDKIDEKRKTEKEDES